MFVPKGGGTLAIFMHYYIDSEKYSCTVGLPLGSFMQAFMPFGTLSAQTLYAVVKVGGGIDPATEVTHFGLN